MFMECKGCMGLFLYGFRDRDGWEVYNFRAQVSSLLHSGGRKEQCGFKH